MILMANPKKRIRRICSNSNCRKIFYCHGECGIKAKIDVENSCFCPECLKKTLQQIPDFYPENSPLLCESRMKNIEKVKKP